MIKPLTLFSKRSFHSILTGACILLSVNKIAAQTPVSLTAIGSAYTQDFNTLSSVASSTNNILAIPGWSLSESGTSVRNNGQYGTDTGASSTGDTYSYGTAGSTDRAFGGLQSGTFISTIGAAFTNNTNTTITSLSISYMGEEWRLGTAGRADQLNFEYSLNATDLTTGTWTGVSALNFATPDQVTTGAKNGNAAPDQALVSSTISSLSIANGATVWIRWTDVNATGADDGLAIDDFTLTPTAPEMDILGNGISIASGDVTPSFNDSTDFGDQVVCNGSVSRTYTITNSGTASLNLASSNNVVLSGTNASDFSVTAFPNSTIGTGSNSTFTIKFDPSASGVRTAIVTIANNDSDENPYTFSIQGNGLGVNLTATVSPTDISCNGLSDGNAMVVAAGNGALTYDWAPGTPTGDGTDIVSGLSAGGYTVTVTDVNNCSVSQLFSINDPAAITASVSVTNVNCNGGNTGSATISATGGTGAFSYTWSPIGGNNATATGLNAGVYSYTVADANSCAFTQTVSVTEPSSPLTASVTSGTLICNGGNTTVTVSATGGTPNYTGTGTFTATAGTYSYTVTDNNSCVATATISIAEPTAISPSVTATPIACNGGNSVVTVTASGGTPNYTGTGTFTVTANTYTYTVTDANTCTATATITVNEPALLTVTATAASIQCNGASTTLTVTASGGTPAYTGTGVFTVTANTYTYTVTDNNSCAATTTITVSEPAAIATNQTLTICSGQSVTVGTNTYTSAGTYTDVLAAINGCDSTVTTNLVVNPLPAVTASVTPADVVCEGTQITLSGNGATTYTWSHGVTDGVAFTPTTTVTYTVNGTDQNNCTGNTIITVTVNPLPVVNVSSTSNTLCVNDNPVALSGTPAGGTYSGTGVSGNSFDPAASGVGTFTLTYSYTDANSCSANATTVITVNGCTGVTGNTNTSEIIVYPNPLSSVINLEVAGANKQAFVTIFNVIGENVYQAIAAQSNTTLDLAGLQNGIYYIQVKTGNGTFTKKIIKQ